ncbi:VOC family protein [Jiangella anatolica]|uniref:Glyoxalase/bleomycin resistance/dioxygenase family protein n=1 Tax=Jiangella anatolica TaxID=2670374 RepID=A0A2W2CW27_9ACTN|nr:VOC family protein [Jiangella anatolica]PZF84433.1 glyoxalase/bleomycin resistance/dioxygenase family protein [Jiangella anatolica]
MAVLSEIVVDCRHAPSLARFWAAVLDGYEVMPYDDAEVARLAALGLTPETDPTVAVGGPGPTLFFQQVPEPKTVKNRVHLDVEAADRAAEVDRLVALGASVHSVQKTWTVLLDPEGNEFCVAQPG